MNYQCVVPRKKKLASLMLNEAMMYKSAATLPKSWSHTGLEGSRLHDFFAKLKKAMEIPVGYQDEASFHFGAEPKDKSAKWPLGR